MADASVDLADLRITHGVVVRPGDTLIIGFSGRLSAQQMDQIKGQLAGYLPNLKFIGLDQVQQIAVYRPEIPDSLTPGED